MTRTDCRCCLKESLQEVFDLGSQPYANAFLASPDQPERVSQLTLMECQSCGHVQLLQVENPSDLYEHYTFMTSTSEQMVKHFAKLLRDNIDKYVSSDGLVVEIGSNDGSVLATITQPVRVLGIDPAKNLATISRNRGVITVNSFFTESLSQGLATEHGKADLIVACNVLAHVNDLDDFCRGIKTLLSDDGAFVLEVPDVNELIRHTEFDTIYHEHLSYFSLRSLIALFQRHGLYVEFVSRKWVHGGSMRVTVRRKPAVSSRVVRGWLQKDKIVRNWQMFRDRCGLLRDGLRKWLHVQRSDGAKIWGYCASAKATVLLNYCGITCDILPVVVDSTPIKQGRFVPGTHQPILPTQEVYEQMPNSVIVLADNHFNSIIRKESDYLSSGGKIVRRSEFAGLRRL